MKRIKEYFLWRWSCEGGYHEFLKVAVPLILSTAAWSVQHFIDRMFLTWYSSDSIAAAMPAGILNFTFMSFFIGIVGYVDTFVAQYYGAGQHKRIGAFIWQGFYISILGGIVLFILSFFSNAIFDFVGHTVEVRANEVIYFKILCRGSFFPIASTAFAAFFAGRGKTWTIMWVNVIGTAVNLIFDYLLIFGKFGFPELGIQGAAIATVMYGITIFIIYIFLIAKKEYNQEYRTLSANAFNLKLTKQLLAFGAPSGVQFFIDIFGFSAFVLIMGYLGTMKLAATNIAFNINTIAFMPMLGCGIAVSVMVGQYIGMRKPEIAQRSVYSGFHITFSYMSFISFLFVVLPELFILPFKAHADPQEFAGIHDIVVVLLRFVAVYSIFDTLNIIFASAIKGAGDTKFVMYIIILLSLGALVIPSYAAIVIFKKGLYAGWCIAAGYVILLGFTFLLRFLKGKWKTMSVIETPIPVVPASLPENPVER